MGIELVGEPGSPHDDRKEPVAGGGGASAQVEEAGVEARDALDLAGARLTQSLVARERVREWGVGGEAMCEARRVLDRHRGALRQERKRGVARVAEEHDSPA